MVLMGDCGSGRHVSTGPGRLSTPSTATERAFAVACSTHKTACGNVSLALVSQHRSTSHCASCQTRMEPVFAATPQRIYAAKAAREAEPLPNGWTRAPQRWTRPWREVRGERRCPNPLCHVGLVHRDGYPPEAMENNIRSLVRGEGGVPIMQRSLTVPKETFPLGGFHLLEPRYRPWSTGADARTVGAQEVRGSRGAGGSGSGR
jgi:hypothetical protein